MKEWCVKVAAPFWAAGYIFIFKFGGVSIFIGLEMLWGIWAATAIMIALYFGWSVIFYLILLQSDSFEHIRDIVDKFLSQRKGKVFEWLKVKFFSHSDYTDFSPGLIMLVFLAESPLTGTPLIRFAYPKEKFWQGIFWIGIGCVIEVVTWFLPVYGGGFSAIKICFSWFHWR